MRQQKQYSTATAKPPALRRKKLGNDSFQVYLGDQYLGDIYRKRMEIAGADHYHRIVEDWYADGVTSQFLGGAPYPYSSSKRAAEGLLKRIKKQQMEVAKLA